MMLTLEEAAARLREKARHRVMRRVELEARVRLPVDPTEMFERCMYGGEVYDIAYSIVRGPRSMIHVLSVYTPNQEVEPEQFVAKEIAKAVLPMPASNIRILPREKAANFTGAKKVLFYTSEPLPSAQ